MEEEKTLEEIAKMIRRGEEDFFTKVKPSSDMKNYLSGMPVMLPKPIGQSRLRTPVINFSIRRTCR